MQRPSILVTGGTGLLGRACLRPLVARHGAEQIVVLVRRGRDTCRLRYTGVGAIEVELTASNLGLASELYDALAKSARSIIHCVADIRFDIPIEESRQVNVVGTENVLRFALSCPKLDKFAHMSTVYVSGGRPGHIPEQEAKPGPFFNSYQRTKFEAEAAVLRAMSVVPATIYRFSTMVYDRTAGRVAQFNYFHQLLRLASVNPLPAIPGLRQAKIDLILSDWAAQMFAFLFEEQWKPGDMIHICAGPKNSLSVGELFDLTFDMFDSGAGRPQLVSRDEFDRMAEAILTTPSRRQLWHRLSPFVPHMNIEQTFECGRLTKATRMREDLKLPDMRAMLRELLSYCIASHWGRQELPPKPSL